MGQQVPIGLEDTGSGPGDWKAQVGAMALSTPRVKGSDEQRFLLMPVVSAEYRNTLYLGSSRVGVGLGGGVHAFRSEHVTWDLGLGLGEGRRESRSDTLAGMGDRGASLFAGTAVGLRAGAFHARVSVVDGLRDEAGIRATAALGLAGRLGGRWSGGITASATLVDAKAMAYDFGVNPDQAQARTALLVAGDPRLRVGEDRMYNPKGGLQEVALTSHLGYAVDEHWRWFALVRAARLQGDAQSSPLTRSKDSGTFGLGFTYRF
jgi:outer membrane scaffolding protein for murein synthesis (MipA/OmpV family)